MRYIENSEPSCSSILRLEDSNRVLEFEVSNYRKFEIGGDYILDINKYWASKSQMVQSTIFDLYRQINNAIETIEDTKVLDRQLTYLIGQLYQYHPYDDILAYVRMSDIKIPQMTNKNEGYIQELTYRTDDYVGLLALVLAMKPMVPIWASYMQAIKNEIGGSLKEYRAASLLKEAGIIHSEGYLRLFSYINEYWNGYTKNHSSAAIIEGIDRFTVPDWLMGNVLVRRISTAPLEQKGDNEDPKIIISAVYNCIENLVSNMDKCFGGRVNNKSADGGYETDEDNSSVIENYKIKQEVSEGVIKAHEVYLRDKPIEILKRIDETCPVENFYKVKDKFERSFKQFEIDSFRLYIVKWVLDPVVTARTLDELGYEAVMNGYHIAYSLLNHWGFNHIALLLYATRHKQAAFSNVKRLKITDEQLTKLEAIYPHRPESLAKRKIPRVEANVGSRAILTLLNNLYGSWWELAPWESSDHYPKLDIRDRITAIPFDIEPMLADMVIHTRGVLYPKLYK